MYVEQLKSGQWAVCQDDGEIICTHKSMSAATRHKREIAEAIRFDRQEAEDSMFLACFRD